ncbi:MAG: lytic murein transglycosylase B, partial [Burkholderiaceae bacterium]
VPYLSRPEVQQYIDEMIAVHGFERAQLERWLGAARYSATVERLMQPPIPFGQRNWYDYRNRYILPTRVQAGLAFWKRHADALERAQVRYGVPPEIIVAIIGVETDFGRITGGFRTIDVMMTLTFDYPRRAEYFRDELTQFLLLAREQKTDPLNYKGSFAGAIGLPQFMPGSIRRWAVDFDGDERIDLARSASDAIGSVASFLSAHGWDPALPILAEAEATEEIVDALGRGIIAQTAWSSALASGVQSDLVVSLDTPVLVIDLPVVPVAGEAERLYRVGTANFAAILAYNRSYFYATSVVELAAAIARSR